MTIPQKYRSLYERDQLLGITKCTKNDLLLTWDDKSYTFKYKDELLLHKPRDEKEEMLIRKFMDMYSDLFEGMSIKGQTIKLEYPYLHLSHPLVSESVLLDGFFIPKVLKIVGNAGLDILADKLAMPYPVSPKIIELIDWGYLNIQDTNLVCNGVLLRKHKTIKQAKYSAAILLFSRYSRLFTHTEYSGLNLIFWDKYKDARTNLRNFAKIEMEQRNQSQDSLSSESFSTYRALLSIYNSASPEW